ncbi:MFS transporter [Dongshaea marina]|uniref:MFS transporter n=1 Tax=Dongshaea marina TaxID=2047966 RepID=UPI000D3EAFE5|nr:MFS transporter [Dongshaea marina]
MRQVLTRVFAVIMTAEFGGNLFTPLITFVFFATNSSLFSEPTSFAKRTMLYGLCLSLGKISSLVANTVVTALSDRLGRKFALNASLLGLALMGAMGVAALLTHQPLLLITGFILFNLLNVDKPAALAIVGDVSNQENRVTHMAVLQTVIALGACLGPIVGGQIADSTFGLQTAYALPFAVAGLIGLLGLWMVSLCTETFPAERRSNNLKLGSMLKGYFALLKTPGIWPILILLILCQISWSTYYEFIPPILKTHFHFSAGQVGWFVGMIAFWLILGTGVIIHLLKRFLSTKGILWVSAIFVFVGISFSLLASLSPGSEFSQSMIWIASVPLAVGDVIFYSLLVSFLSESVSADKQGQVMGLNYIVITLIWSGTAVVGSYLMTINTQYVLMIAPIGGLGLLIAMGFFPGAFWFLRQAPHRTTADVSKPLQAN